MLHASMLFHFMYNIAIFYLELCGPITIVIGNRNRDYTRFVRDRVIVIVIVIPVQCT